MAIVIAVDPGKNTGWATYNTETDEFESGQIDGPFQFLKFLSLLISTEITKGLAIVVEDYIITAETLKKSRQPYSLKLIGVIEWMCHLKDIPFFLQTPREAKAFSNDNKIKHMNWWSKNHDHANDAARHLLLFAIKRQIINPERLISGPNL